MQVSTPMAWLFQTITIALSIQLRYKCVLFIRYNPWGDGLLEEIYLLWVLCFCLWTGQTLLCRGYSAESKLPKGRTQIQPFSALFTLVSGRLDMRSQRLTFASFMVTTLFPIMVVDFVYRPQWLHQSRGLSFSRMGYIDETSAKIVLRHPYHDGIRLDYRAAYDTDPLGSDTAFGNAWKGAGVIFTTPESDYTATFDLKQLHPDTKYQYRTNVGHAGSFTTMVSNPDKFTLISSSCIKPGFPYSPFQHSLSIHGLSHLSRYLERTKIDMMLFLGDFIYIDLPKRFGYSVEDYQTAYRQVYASPDWTDALRALPWVHAYDDHEITNNWDGNQSGIYQEAITPFLNYQHNGNPAPVQQESTYYTFSRGQVSFFVLDTRRHRSPGANIDGPDKTMLGREQLASVMRWLKTAPGWKVLLSSVPFTRNFQATDEEDYWAGYLYERQEILNAMWQTDGVLIITGDRHEHATTAFPPPGASNTTVIEFSTSPLSQFVNPFVKSYKQVAGTDVAINYHHEGRSKFGSFTFDTSDPYTWKMDYELIVDGASVWNYTVIQDRKQS